MGFPLLVRDKSREAQILAEKRQSAKEMVSSSEATRLPLAFPVTFSQLPQPLITPRPFLFSVSICSHSYQLLVTKKWATLAPSPKMQGQTQVGLESPKDGYL